VRVTPNLDTINSFEICNPANPDFMQTDPAICYNGENYIVAWPDEKNGVPNIFYTTVARVSPQGVVLDTGVCISTGAGISEYRPNIAFDGERCFVVWYKSSNGIYGRFVNGEGLPEGNVLTIAYDGTGGPNLAFDGTNYLVVWFTGTYPDLEIYGRLISSQGTLVGDVINIALGSGCHRWADVKFDGTNYLVVWQTGDNSSGQIIYGQFIDTNGVLVGSSFMISNNTNISRWWPALAVSDRNFLVTWGQGTSSDIYGNVDVFVTGIDDKTTELINYSYSSPTIFSGTLIDFAKGKSIIYDVTGRKLKSRLLKSGIYFIESGGQISKKIIKVR